MAAAVSAPPTTTVSTPIITCPYTAGGCPLFNTIDLNPASPRCAGSCSPAPNPRSPPPAVSSFVSASGSAPSSSVNIPSALQRPPLLSRSTSNSIGYDDTSLLFSQFQSDVPLPLPSALLKQDSWASYLDFAVSPESEVPAYFAPLPHPAPAASTSASASSSAGPPPLDQAVGPSKHSLWDIEELVPQQQGAHKRTRTTPPPAAVMARSVSGDLASFGADISVERQAGSASTSAAHSPAPSTDEEKEVVTPFISKLTYLLEHREYEAWIRWDASGNNILIAHTKPHLLEILARYFRHTTVASFVRQLNIYGFKRASTSFLLSILDTVSFPSAVPVPGHTEPDTFSAADYSAFSNPAFFRSVPGGRHCRLGSLKPITKERGPRNRSKKAQATKRKAEEAGDSA
ncbi:hypothetical protein JCM11641_002824 [Rhodosporidiobolus odoratus]